ncbi:hypothetical protein [Streptomyces sp. CC210A]|uniref:hypothetical protein n=1 Tax=Streptomyces sp. CC210A TaxID=2898184 RepID=UPI001F42C3E9|nr:hypothetical protein [Streptomyces sp. CC210A]
MTTPDLIWTTLLVLGAAYELYALADTKDGDTLSERVRAWFRVHTHPGRATFAIAWTGFATWFLIHILT